MTENRYFENGNGISRYNGSYNMSLNSLFALALLHLIGWPIMGAAANSQTPTERPNILLIIADDWSFPHASVYGDRSVKTPHFDRIAREGLLFDHAYVSSPSCTPSRASILTGQHFWRLKEGANLYGPLRPEFQTYPQILEEHGYFVGYSEKGWGPGNHDGRDHNPAGPYFRDFTDFLSNKPQGAPFCYWFGSFNPHRGYQVGSGEKAGINLKNIDLPPFFPDVPEVRGDLADYYAEVQDFDDEIGEILFSLEQIEQLDKTLIVVTSDNGMPFPRCKSNLYDFGVRVPLAIRWRQHFDFSGIRSIPISLTDLAPTFLEAAGIEIPDEVTGQSLLPLFRDDGGSLIREYVYFGKERHVPGQEQGDWRGYPMRAIRSHQYLYIENLFPHLWPAGTPNFQTASFYPGYFADIDGSPTRSYMIRHRQDSKDYEEIYHASFNRRPAEELYDLRTDPDQVINVASDPAYQKIKTTLFEALQKERINTGDPRLTGDDEVFENFPYTGGTILPPTFVRKNRHFATFKIDAFPTSQMGNPTVEILTPINVRYEERFPVIYMLDGQNLFHEITASTNSERPDWQVDEVLDSMHLATGMDKAIVVGIHSDPVDRTHHFTPDRPARTESAEASQEGDDIEGRSKHHRPQAKDYLRFIVDELKPYIDANFKVKREKEATFIAGADLAGLTSTYAICEYPDVFGGSASLSPSWSILDDAIISYLTDHLPDPTTHRIFFDHFRSDIDLVSSRYQEEVDDIVIAKGYDRNSNWNTRVLGATESEHRWRNRLTAALQFLLDINSR